MTYCGHRRMVKMCLVAVISYECAPSPAPRRPALCIYVYVHISCIEKRTLVHGLSLTGPKHAHTGSHVLRLFVDSFSPSLLFFFLVVSLTLSLSLAVVIGYYKQCAALMNYYKQK